jgi:hypothetical protein
MSEAIAYPIVKRDTNGKITYFESSTGSWYKSEFNTNGKETKYEDSDGHWYKREFDADGNKTKFESSNGIVINY